MGRALIGQLLTFRRARVLVSVELSDEALLAACATGDRAALGILFDRHRVEVHRFLGRLRVRDPRDVEDLLQATFIEALRSAAKFRRRCSVRTWLMAIAVNVSRHHARSEGRRSSAMQGLASLVPVGGDDPAGVAERRQRSSRLRAALAELKDHLRVPFLLCDVEGVPGEEAARALGLPLGSLHRRLHDARKLLARALEEGEL
jgi:RNA polymerase sigma-70 factor (ECF subfamily)